jgi:hypothetical protein
LIASQDFASPYMTTDATPIGLPVSPRYNNTARTITVPSGYGDYTWYVKDGTPCTGVSNPTPDCGDQKPSTVAPTFPNSTEWTWITSTEKGNVTFYGVPNLILNLSLATGSLVIGSPSGLAPSGSGVFESTSNIATVTTNNSTGYKLTISTDQSATNPNASNMLNQNIANTYLQGTANACVWNDGSSTLTNTNVPLSNNTWGFTLAPASLADRKLCRVPNSNSPLTVKSTTAADMAGDDTTVYYGVKVDTTQLSGRYEATMVYTALANPEI